MFLYYLPGVSFFIPAPLKYALDTNCHRRQVIHGPNGSPSGWLVCDPSIDTDLLKLKESEQTWKPVPEWNGAMVGLWRSTPVTPDSVARASQQSGHWVTLGDGSRWLCAIARGLDPDSLQPYSPLPRMLDYDPASGKWRPGEVEPPYQNFLGLSLEYLKEYYNAMASEKNSFTFEQIDALAIAGLTVNYRLSSVELSFLTGAYTLAARRSLVDAIIDHPTFLAWSQKKTESASAGSST